jgi:apolipoprotein N-acyltransferase
LEAPAVRECRGTLIRTGSAWKVAGAASSGALFAAALPPYDVPLVGFIAFAPLLAAISRARANTILYLAMLTALTAAVLLLGVPREASYTLVLVPFLVFGMFLAAVLATARWLGMERGASAVWGVAAMGVLVEWLAAQVDFPYTVAFTVWRDTPLLWLAAFTGVWGLAFVLWLVNAAVAQAFVLRRATPLLLTVLGVLALLHVLGWLQMAVAREGETVRVAVIQSDDSRMATLLREAKQRGAQIAVLPETCCAEQEAIRWAQTYQLYLAFGYWGEGNSAALASPDGRLSLPYFKMHAYGGEPRSWQRGDPVRAFDSPFGRIGAVICYDTMFSDSCRLQARNGVRLIAVPTYDPVTPRLVLHHIHAATTTLRAAEHRVPLARAEFRAGSMIVDSWGRVLAQADESTSLAIADVPLGNGRATPATQLGDAFVLLCALLIGSSSLARHGAGRGRSFRE